MPFIVEYMRSTLYTRRHSIFFLIGKFYITSMSSKKKQEEEEKRENKNLSVLVVESPILLLVTFYSLRVTWIKFESYLFEDYFWSLTYISWIGKMYQNKKCRTESDLGCKSKRKKVFQLIYKVKFSRTRIYFMEWIITARIFSNWFKLEKGFRSKR